MIKGYDAQVMLHRSVDLTRDTNAMQRRTDTVQSLLVDQQREKIEREQESVLHTEETQEGKIRPDADSRRREKPLKQQQQAKEEEETAEADASEPKVFPIHNRVDIRV